MAASKFKVICGFLARSQHREKRLSVVMSVGPHGTTRLPLDGFSGNLIFENFS
jgi:hypothetical protein